MAVAISIDVYHFDAIGNKFTRKETTNIPMPAQVVRANSPDNSMRTYSKIIYNRNGVQTEAYVAQTVAQVTTLMNA